MDDGNANSSPETHEHSFNLDDWMKELLPDQEDVEVEAEFGMGQAGILLPPPSVNNFSQENKSVQMEKSYQIDATSLQSNVLPNICQNSKPMVSASGSSIIQVRQNIPSSLSTKYSGFPESQTSSNMVTQIHPHHQFQHQVLLMHPANRPNIQSSALHSNSHLSNLRQQQPIHKESPTFGMLQQHKIGNQSSSFMVNGQESFNVVQHSDQSTSHKQIMQLPQKMQLQVQPKLQRTAFLHSQNVMAIDQKMPANQSQPIQVGSSQGLLNYNSQAGLMNSNDWVDPAFQQIQFIKEMYMSDLIKLFERSQELMHQATNAESVEKHERNRTFAEKIIRFLQFSKMDLMMNYRKEKLYNIISEVRTNLERLIAKNHVPLQRHPQQLVEMSGGMMRTSQMQQRPNFLQYKMSNQCLNSPRAGMPLSLRQQGTNKFQVSPSVGLRDTSSIRNSNAYNLMGSGFQKGVEHMARNMLLHPVSGIANSNDTMTLHQRVASSKNIHNSLDSSVSSITQKSISISPQQNKHRDQAMEIPNLKQPLQQSLAEKNKRQVVPKLNNDLKYGYISGFNQNQPMSSSYHVISPQNSQHSSTYIEPKDFSSTFSNSATPILSISSPAVVPSPMTPSSAPLDSEKCHSRIHSLSLDERRKVHQMPAALSQLKNASNQSLVTEETGLLKSPLLAESTSPVVNQSPLDKENPLGRLVEAVKSLSTRALNSSIRDICAVTNMTDRTARSLSHSESDRIFVQDLADDIRNYEDGNYSLIYGSSRMKRRLSTMVSDDSISEMELNADSPMKRLKKEDLILQEIKEINQKLIESKVEVINTKDVFRAEADKGIVIRCCYSPVGLAGEIRIPGSSEKTFLTLLLEMIVTPDYPNSSPVVSEEMPLDFSGDEQGKDLWTKAKSIFTLSLRKCSHPISLKEMVKTWDASARAVLQEFAEQRGGGSFSSRYGKWENHISFSPVS
ncbi:mediator of RNA polymerase II transcription subunit 15a-like [Henckelia pumila]|uniref:mediator of RNA polymerase II transcription subunit 15a-like n=1 Tax=Henckelia pumila TaxID=405737 RepID=UPI003C6DF0D1